MEFGSVVQFLEDKTILITGATGFLAKSTSIPSSSLSLSLSFFLSNGIMDGFNFSYNKRSSFGEDIKSATKCEEDLPSFKSC
jgi:hypothetical protein